MATISTANFLAIADNIAKTLVDLETAFVTNPGANAPTIATITAGQTAGSNSLEARVAALADVVQERDLAGAAYIDANSVVSYLTVSTTAFYALFKEMMNALETHTGGVQAFLLANTLLVHPEFANAFNYFAPNASALGLRNAPATKIAPTRVFVATEQILGSIAVTGASAGTFSAGTPVDTTKYAPEALFLKNTAGISTVGTATSFTLTYTNAAGASTPATQALSGALGAGAYLAVSGATGSAVSNIVVNSGGVNADAIAVVVKPARTIAY